MEKVSPLVWWFYIEEIVLASASLSLTWFLVLLIYIYATGLLFYSILSHNNVVYSTFMIQTYSPYIYMLHKDTRLGFCSLLRKGV